MNNKIAAILKSDLPDGAKLAAIAILATGAETIREIAEATNRKPRTTERHYADLRARGYANLRVPYADLRVPTTQICGTPRSKMSVGTVLAPPRAHFESSFGRYSTSEEQEESVDRESPLTTHETRGEDARASFSKEQSGRGNYPYPTDQHEAEHHPNPTKQIFRGRSLRIDLAQHQAWVRMFPEAELRGLYPIVDADCADKGKANGEAVVWAQKKIGFLLRDEARARSPKYAGPIVPPWELPAGLSGEERDAAAEAYYRKINPGYMGKG